MIKAALKSLLAKIWEALISTLPVFVLVLIVTLTMTKIDGLTIGLFSAGAVLLVVGMAIFNLGADTAMIPMGDSVGTFISKTKKSKLPLILLICLIIGFVITIAEPDVHVLASQLSEAGKTNFTLLLSVAAGAGIFVVVSVIKTFFNIKLKYVLLGSYAIIFTLGAIVQFVNPSFLGIAFDSGAVTTGPMTTPFLISLGIGIAAARGSKGSQEDSFGMLALCSAGPIIAVMILGLTGIEPKATAFDVPSLNNVSDIFIAYAKYLPISLQNVAVALVPIVVVFFMFQLTVLKLKKAKIIKIIVGIVYTFIGLTIFLTGVEVGFLTIGNALGRELAANFKGVLIPLAVVLGAVVVLAEPAVHILNKEVEEVTAGAISKKVMLIGLCIGVAVACGLAMIRVVFELSIWWFVIPVYAIALILMFFVPPIFTGIAFDSGGVASGSMMAAFMLPFAVGASTQLHGEASVLTNAFGMVAFVAMMPLIIIQVLGLVYKFKSTKKTKAMQILEQITKVEIIKDMGAAIASETIDFDMSSIVEEADISAEEFMLQRVGDKGFFDVKKELLKAEKILDKDPVPKKSTAKSTAKPKTTPKSSPIKKDKETKKPDEDMK